MAKYKDYPVYTYDEPATYSDFSGGINTDPSNEHLQSNEMRDCLNMHYSSAALVKRKGASLLCNIECEDELYNVQGIFLFTYKTTYIIIAANGKLYKGFYSPKATIRLSRLPISVDVPKTTDAYNPLDVSVGLTHSTSESINSKHDGFIYNYVSDEYSNKVILDDSYLGDYRDLDKSIIKDGDIIKYNDNYYKLKWITKETPEDNRFIQRQLITPETVIEEVGPDKTITYTTYWISLDDYNTKYAEDIATRTDPLSKSYGWVAGVYSGLVLDTLTNTWKLSGYYITPIDENNNKLDPVWVFNGTPGVWSERYEAWEYTQAVTYKDKVYICTKTHTNYINPPDTLIANADAEWYKLVEKKELLFQNHDNIEAATYDNKLYIATGTRFIVVELSSNELIAHTVEPYSCNTTEITNIGYNYLSPYPELCRITQYDQAITSIGGLLAIKNMYGTYTLTPQMNFAQGETENEYYFKWEKKVSDEWITIYSYKNNTFKTIEDSVTVLNKINLFTIDVSDADKYQYRVSFAKSFEQDSELSEDWDYNHGTYSVGDTVSVQLDTNGATETYVCIKEHDPKQVIWDNCQYQITDKIQKSDKSGYYYTSYELDAYGNYITTTASPVFSASTSSKTSIALYEKQDDDNFKFVCYDTSAIIKGDIYWEKQCTEEAILTEDGVDYDWIVNEIDGEYFGQATSTLAVDLEPEDTFNIIQSCKKITSEGNKFLLYDDKYNSGSWYKTIIDNPAYITQRGGLSFKTNKNETLIKVVSFNGNLIAFANAENVGGSIHMVTGNGDDYDDSQGYYSPYRRSTINSSISCDNANTVQVCENILVFKYFDTLYYISGSDLTNEVVSVYSCNDRIKHNNNFVTIPWDDNTCISEVTEDYYALLWKEKYIVEDNDLILERPAIKVKMYYKLGFQLNEKIVYPWLRDESDYFNIDHILYIKGKPIYLYNNTLTTFHSDVYTDFGKNYKCLIHFRGEDLNYAKMIKLINNVMVYYHRNQYSTINFDLTVKNEAGHILLDSSVKRVSLQDLRALRTGDILTDGEMRLDSTILDSKVFNTAYKFPCLLADSIITATNDKEFSISSITYNYITAEVPEQTQYDLYSNILRPKEVK